MDRREFFGTLGAGAIVGGATAYFACKQPEVKPCKLAGTPLDEMCTYLCAFHVEKGNMKNQVEAHHWCMALRDGVFQCVVLDNNTMPAKLLGVEYIVTDEIFQKLPEKEKELWHPHDYEVTSGLLVVPDMTEKEELEYMKIVKGTWGKTYHTWADPNTDLPYGEPILMDAFRKDGEIDPELLLKRDKKLKINTEKIKQRRIGI
jgi:hypothetical protein